MHLIRRVLLRALHVLAIPHAFYVLSSGNECAELTLPHRLMTGECIGKALIQTSAQCRTGHGAMPLVHQQGLSPLCWNICYQS